MPFKPSQAGLLSIRLPTVIMIFTLALSACGGAPVRQTTGLLKTTLMPMTTSAVPSPTSLSQIRPSRSPAIVPTETHSAPIPAISSVLFPELQQIAMQDEQNGWGLSQDAIYYTTDGGQSWQNVTPRSGWMDQSIVKGFFLNQTTAWLIQPNQQDFNHGTLFRTTDRGQTWEAIQVPFGPDSMQFLNSEDGWVMADRGAAAGSMAVDIYKTTDSGSTWTKIRRAGPQSQNHPGALPFGGDKSGMAFKNMQEGWIGGTQPVMGHSYLYRTKDNGKTWTSQVLNIPDTYASSSVMVFAPKFFTDQDGILPVILETQVQSIDFYITRDGGQSWQSTTVVQDQEAYDIASMQDIWVWNGSTLSVSHDSAQTWNSLKPEISLRGKIKQLDFINQHTGWAISMNSQENMHLYQTRDGGKTWK